MSHTIYTPTNYSKSNRALIAAKYSKARLTVKEYSEEVANNGNFPISALPPLFESSDKTFLFEANAIAYYLGDKQLQGDKNVAEVSQWVNYSDLIHIAVAAIFYPSQGVVQMNKSEAEKAKVLLVDYFKKINSHLSTRTFLVNQRITQADITLFTTIQCLLETHYEESQIKSTYPHLYRWAATIGNQPEVIAVIGNPIKFCSKPIPAFDAKKYGELHPTGDTKKTSKKEVKEPKKKVEKQEEKSPAVPEYVDPFVSMPKGTFDMDEFKRAYSNKDIASEAIPHFWKNFDKDNYSIWHCVYNFPDELQLVFMTSNLIDGMFQRLERLRKYAFGCMVVLGTDGNSNIEGIWVLRGTELAFNYHESLNSDSDSYTWKRLDAEADSTKKEVEKFFLRDDGNYDGRPVAATKVYK